MQIAVLGIDLGKNSCSLVGLDGQGKAVKRRRMRPASIVGFTKPRLTLYATPFETDVRKAPILGARGY
jgi:hypothetical protein